MNNTTNNAFDITSLSQDTLNVLNNIKKIDLDYLEYTKLERKLKDMKAKIEKYNNEIMQVITENKLNVFTTDYFKFSIKPGYTRNVVNVDKLKQDGIYNDYIKESETKPALHREVKDLLEV